MAILAVLSGLVPLVGCMPAVRYVTPQRTSRGYTMILPGIEGGSVWNMNIAAGLVDGGVPSEIEVYDWTLSVVGFAANLRFQWRNEQEALKIANKIAAYQNLHPGCPVHIIGHSGGGGIAIMALERLPAGHEISSALLLAPAVSPDYDLRSALRRTRFGIWNYYSPYDVGFLGAGTSVMGTVDGKWTRAAGNVGFHLPARLSDADRQLYVTRLHQQPYTREMSRSGHDGGHGGWAARGFVRDWLAPIVRGQFTARDPAHADGAGGTVNTPQPKSPESTSFRAVEP